MNLTLDGFPVAETGWAGVVLILIVMLFRGTLVTRREVDGIKEESAWLRETNEKLVATNAELLEGLHGITDVVRTNNDLIASVVNESRARRSAAAGTQEDP